MDRKTVWVLAFIGMTCVLPAIGLSSPAAGSADQHLTGAAAPGAAASSAAILYLYRQGVEDAYHMASVRLDDEPAVDIEAGSHVVWRLTPGGHRIETNDDRFSLAARAGVIYYLRLNADRNFWGRWRHTLTLVAEEEGRQAVAGTGLMAEKQQQEQPVRPLMPPVVTAGKFHLEPAVFLGFGTTSVELGKTAAGETVKISGGGGAGLGMTIGYGLSRSFDLEATVGHQVSRIIPESVTNASANFDRTFYLVTLKYRIPVQDRFYVKLGAGAGYYQPGKLDINTTQIPGGSSDVVHYDDATGFHATAEWEIFFQPNFSLTVGGKYYHVIYKETGGTRNGVPGYFNDGNVKNFGGSGFDFSFAAAFYL